MAFGFGHLHHQLARRPIILEQTVTPRRFVHFRTFLQPLILSLFLALFLVACGTAAPAAPTGQSTTGATGDTAISPSDAQKADDASPAKIAPDSTMGATGGQPESASAGAGVPTPETTGGAILEGPTKDTSTSVPVEIAQVIQQATPTPEAPPTDDYTGPVGGNVGDRAAEIEGIKAWLNSEPLTVAQLRGKVVLIDFWTYTCINCIHTYPFLKLWHSRYADDGLVIIGVHSPEFEFEKDQDNVTRATQVDGIVWPVAMDNDFVTWRNYSNRFWPAKYLIDQNGEVRYTHFGEGGYAETEEKIRELLLETGATFIGGDMPLPTGQTVDATYLNERGAEVTRELYGGYERGYNDFLYGRGGYFKQNAYYNSPNTVADFESPGSLEPHQIYLDGPWLVGPESIKHGRETGGHEDTLSIIYSAVSVNAVLTSESGKDYKVRITVDGEYLTDENKGEDIIIGSDGESYLMVDEARLYQILANSGYKQRERLTMSSDSSDFGLFAFTFDIYQKGQ
jgi:thiol-disulfide isomerase/thioredoxin